MLDPSPPSLLDVSHVSQSFAKGSGEPGAPVLQGRLADAAHAARSSALLGRSGCGKSTLLRHHLRPRRARPAGTVTLDGKPVDGPAEGVAMVFQSFALFPWLDRARQCRDRPARHRRRRRSRPASGR